MPFVKQRLNFRNYYVLARMHSPVGTFLFFWPFAYALFMVAYRTNLQPSALVSRLLVYAGISVTLRSAACVWNDICDVDFDRQVERTKIRPLASGAMSMAGAHIYVILLGTAFFATLTLLSSKSAVYHGIFDIAVLNVIYPYMKRVTYLPQVWLGITINWGFIVVWVDLAGASFTPWSDLEILVCSMVSLASWTIVYDTIYACQDLNDDQRVGVKSTAILFGHHLPIILKVFAAIYLGALTYTGYLNGQGAWFYSISVFGSAVHMLWQLETHNPLDSLNCKDRFQSNITLGGIVVWGLAADYFVKVII
ncbi:4-hydroxybenzoate polyprenyl transferase [Gymnopus androsaceus JB14]|uniref:4-hydroxybenzoate polyprenyl transferase n=1 Tax=Gymnopus androsaceus JB14 TaxID=1447944 RepID=A0A6A4H7S7_9AGAR|nr:4-hydroxybenzoate polyprenyl transferase [Gymnopus androsaceus JB14]